MSHIVCRPSGSPTPAERARRLVESASSVTLDIDGLDLVRRPGIPPWADCAVLPDSRVALLVARTSALHRVAALARGRELRGRLEAVAVAPVAVPDRVLGHALAEGVITVAGTDMNAGGLFPSLDVSGCVLLLMDVEHLTVDDLWGCHERVALAEFGRAAVDPIVVEEAALLQHLAAAHSDQLRLLADTVISRLPGSDGRSTVVPVALDRFGLRVRIFTGPTAVDALFEFDRPVLTPTHLRQAFHALFTRAGAL